MVAVIYLVTQIDNFAYNELFKRRNLSRYFTLNSIAQCYVVESRI